ncbi:dihydroxyacetone kinase subunit L [Finegoldia magna]|uniref:dihydroxyacetone kinase subunit L n=1 Tax=Finegoldia magna TaxID=1260 RepID=UPI0027B9D35D|nr:dihydroxyacetone kinase subunit L [Finegoldia magna]MDU1400257.1 dihydroxyacetone kinase subunit L [Finegoldia magna]MDU7385868.1 dihydroxyacetone kinase subunit L [Finegoldia magna]
MGFTNDDIYKVFTMYQECLMVNCSLLNKLDENLSNRDHGSNLNNGFRELFTTFPDFKSENLSTQFINLSFLFTYKVKGATSPIYSYVFDKVSAYLTDVDVIDREMFGEILKITTESVKLVGNCKLNDKTILDCIHAATESFEKNKNENTIKLMKKISVDCKIACEQTSEMTANKGKARHNAIFSVGVIDPGAYSLFLFFDTLYKYVLKKRRTK